MINVQNSYDNQTVIGRGGDRAIDKDSEINVILPTSKADEESKMDDGRLDTMGNSSIGTIDLPGRAPPRTIASKSGGYQPSFGGPRAAPGRRNIRQQPEAKDPFAHLDDSKKLTQTKMGIVQETAAEHKADDKGSKLKGESDLDDLEDF